MTTSSQFSDFLRASSLVDIPIMGSKFTWSNKRDDPTFSKSDRFIFESN